MGTFSPSDWPENFPEIQEIDNLLRCPICFELMSTSLIIPKCSHNYCSLCIRQYIRYKNQCPTCNESVCEIDLRNNRIVDQAISAFSLVRERLLNALKNTHASIVTTSVSCTSAKKDKSSDRISTGLQNIRGLCVPGKPLIEVEIVNPNEDDSDIKKPRTARPKKHISSSEDSEDSDIILCDDISSTENKRKVAPRKASSAARKFLGSPTSIGSPTDSDEDFVPFTPKAKKDISRKHQRTSPASLSPTKTSPCDRVKDNDEEHNGKKTHVCREPPICVNPMELLEKNTTVLENVPSLSNMTSQNTPTHSTIGTRLGSIPDDIVVSQGFSLSSPSVKTSQARSITQENTNRTSPSTSTVTSSGRAPCPVCGVSIPQRNINLHLDVCLRNQEKYQQKSTIGSSPFRRKPMPKLVYNLMSDKEIRKRLALAKLPTNGDKKTMIARHQEFTLLYNSECDNENPKPSSQIVREMEKKTHIKNNLVATDTWKGKLVIEKGADSYQVEKAQKSYLNEHKSQFSLLVKQARQNARKKREQLKAAGDNKNTEDSEINCEAPVISIDSSDINEPISPQPNTDTATFTGTSSGKSGGPDLPTLDIPAYELPTDSEPEDAILSDDLLESREGWRDGLDSVTQPEAFTGYLQSSLSPRQPTSKASAEAVPADAASDVTLPYEDNQSDTTLPVGGNESDATISFCGSDVEDLEHLAEKAVSPCGSVTSSPFERPLSVQTPSRESIVSAPTPSPSTTDSLVESSKSVTLEKPGVVLFDPSQELVHDEADVPDDLTKNKVVKDLLSTLVEDAVDRKTNASTSHPTLAENSPTTDQESNDINVTSEDNDPTSEEASKDPEVKHVEPLMPVNSESEINTNLVPDSSPEFVRSSQRASRKRNSSAVVEPSSQSTADQKKRRKQPVAASEPPASGRRLTRAQLRSQQTNENKKH